MATNKLILIVIGELKRLNATQMRLDIAIKRSEEYARIYVSFCTSFDRTIHTMRTERHKCGLVASFKDEKISKYQISKQRLSSVRQPALWLQL